MGAKRIGILPLDETVKPSYPTVKDGNVVRKTYASVRGRELDPRFKVLSGKEANVSAQETEDLGRDKEGQTDAPVEPHYI